MLVLVTLRNAILLVRSIRNALVLRQRTADARGFGEDIKPLVLAKLMLAERFLPQLFDEIAMATVASSKGVSKDLESLEAIGVDAEKPGTVSTVAASEHTSMYKTQGIVRYWMTPMDHGWHASMGKVH